MSTDPNTLTPFSSTARAEVGLKRLAGGVALERLCEDLTRVAAPLSMDLRGPTEKYDFRTRSEIIDTRSFFKYRFDSAGVSQTKLNAFGEFVPSLFEKKVSFSVLRIHYSCSEWR